MTSTAARITSVRTAELDAAYEEHGPSDGDVVVLLHGFPYDPRCFDSMATPLAAGGYRVIVPYLRGYGPTRFLSTTTMRSGQQAALVRGRLWSPSWRFDDADFAQTALSFENPDFVAVVVHSYRHRYGYAGGDPALDAIEAAVHAVDLHDLPAAAAAALMRDAQRTSLALAAITGAVKLNYEIHGNTLPHLHMHFFPRYRGDRFEGRPIDAELRIQPVYGDGEFERLRTGFLHQLGERR